MISGCCGVLIASLRPLKVELGSYFSENLGAFSGWKTRFVEQFLLIDLGRLRSHDFAVIVLISRLLEQLLKLLVLFECFLEDFQWIEQDFCWVYIA